MTGERFVLMRISLPYGVAWGVAERFGRNAESHRIVQVFSSRRPAITECKKRNEKWRKLQEISK